MSDIIAIISSATISEEALLALVLEEGGYKHMIKGGGFARGEAHFWAHIDNLVLIEIHEDAPAVYQQITAQLGGEPQTCIVLDIGHPADLSHSLALDFALACMRKWPCVVDRMEEEHSSYTQEEIAQMHKEGRSFFDM